MRFLSRFSRILVSAVSVTFLVSCAHTKAMPEKPMEFEPGMKALAESLADQLGKSSVGKTLNKVVINPQTGQSQLKKVVIDAFFDSDSGYPLKINPTINRIISDSITRRFAAQVEVPETTEVADYVVTGMVSLEGAGAGRRYKVYSAVFEKATGVVQASAEVRIANFDTTPDIQEQAPAVQNGSQDEHPSTAKKKQSKGSRRERR